MDKLFLDIQNCEAHNLRAKRQQNVSNCRVTLLFVQLTDHRHTCATGIPTDWSEEIRSLK